MTILVGAVTPVYYAHTPCSYIVTTDLWPGVHTEVCVYVQWHHQVHHVTSPLLWKLLQHSHRSRNTVHLHKESETIRIKRGVRQGDTISPKLFTATLESIFRRLNWEHKGVKIDGEFLSNLRFADDIFLCTETPQELQQMLQELSDESRRMGLKMNTTKTKVIVVDNTRGVARGKCMWKQVRWSDKIGLCKKKINCQIDVEAPAYVRTARYAPEHPQ